MNKHQLANVYAQVGLESAVLSASQQQLTSLLFEGVLNALAQASIFMGKQQVIAKGDRIAKAISIIDNGLMQSIEAFADEPLAAQLITLYDYIIRQLLLANLHNDEAKLAHCRELLQQIAEAWQLSLANK